MSRKRDFERMARQVRVYERGAAAPCPPAPKKTPEGLAEQRGWVRPAVQDWNRSSWLRPP